jgi:RimJ/RimL family protein N-acetyltransferase
MRPWTEQDIPALVAAHRDPGAVGYWVVASARGHGIAARALCAVSEWAFRLPWLRPLERLELIHAVGNLASCRVADKAGFTLSAVLPPLLPEFPNDGHLRVRLPDNHQELYEDGYTWSPTFVK